MDMKQMRAEMDKMLEKMKAENKRIYNEGGRNRHKGVDVALHNLLLMEVRDLALEEEDVSDVEKWTDAIYEYKANGDWIKMYRVLAEADTVIRDRWNEIFITCGYAQAIELLGNSLFNSALLKRRLDAGYVL